ncbi:hypothetical protein M422DRAFT_272549 [Sphaerobolus stellatus SS14]|uniref:Uncharacterized protein n=1 Tax=Sphaerobolus stellatus (strain SS14) TaxID=990650 RepID=A0A0C9ULU8_SPHS4|nr:hypothetical protein M422DRAFT_272549 [Sphaerobolus stellatus SS14]
MYLMQDYNMGKPGEHDRFVPLRTALKTAPKTQSIDCFGDTKALTLQFMSKMSEEGYGTPISTGGLPSTTGIWPMQGRYHLLSSAGCNSNFPPLCVGQMPVGDGSPPALMGVPYPSSDVFDMNRSVKTFVSSKLSSKEQTDYVPQSWLYYNLASDT